MPINVVCLRQINNREHREDESLKRDYKHMKHRPDPLQTSAEQSKSKIGAKHGRNQYKNHLPGIHIPEQTQPQRDWLSNQRN